MTETATPDAPTDTDEDAEVEALVADETPLATTQEANLARVVAQSEDERQGIYGQTIQ